MRVLLEILLVMWFIFVIFKFRVIFFLQFPRWLYESRHDVTNSQKSFLMDNCLACNTKNKRHSNKKSNRNIKEKKYKSAPSPFPTSSQKLIDEKHAKPKRDIFSIEKFHSERDDNIFFGSGFVPCYELPSTSFPHYCAYTSNQYQYAEKKVMVSLLSEEKALAQQQIKEWIEGVVGKHSKCWIPILDMGYLYGDMYYSCSPFFSKSITSYLNDEHSLSLMESQVLSLFILSQCLKLEEMHLGFQEKFSLDYVFLKDEKKGITFDNLVMGGYHAISLLDSKPSVLQPVYFDFMHACLSMIERRCVKPFSYYLWSLPLIHAKGHLTNVYEFHTIFEMVSTNILLVSSCP